MLLLVPCSMMRHFFIIASFIFIQVIHPAESQEPDLCKLCTCVSEFELDCSDRQLNDFIVPLHFNATKITDLKLDHNDLTTIPSLSAFSHLQKLSLAFNKITELPADAFSGLSSLEMLDISMNEGFLLSDSSVSQNAFQSLHSLRIIRMKQELQPNPDFNYYSLAPTYNTLEQMFVTGTPSLSTALSHFSKLHTLSLGGAGCNITSLSVQQMKPLASLSLRRLSARHCNIMSVEIDFLQRFQRTLEKLDLSCNPLKPAFGNITRGIRYSKLNTLIIDNIIRPSKTSLSNRQQDCLWSDISHSDLEPLKTVPLKILSIQANGFVSSTTLNLRKYCLGVQYLDISYNYLNGTTLQVARVLEDQPVPSNNKIIFHNPNFQLPSLRYIGLRNLGFDRACEIDETNDFKCDQDSDLFIDNDFSWDANHDPNIMDLQLLKEMVELEQAQDSMTIGCPLMYVLFGRKLITCIMQVLSFWSRSRQADGQYFPTDTALTNTVSYIWDEVDGDLSKLEAFFLSRRYLLANLTTLSLGYNYLYSYEDRRQSELCSNFEMFPNNLMTLDLSGSQLGFLPCRNISGFTYLQNLTCNGCKISGWFTDFFSGFPIKFIHLRGAEGLATNLQTDKQGSLFSGAPQLEVLDISDVGISYFSDSNFFTHTPKLKNLFLQNNHLRDWNVTIVGNSELRILDLRDNSITSLSNQARHEFTNLSISNGLQVYLEGNDVECSDCTSDFIVWLLNSSAIADTHKVKCRSTRLLLRDHCLEKQKVISQLRTSAVGQGNAQRTADEGIAAIVVSSCAILGAIIVIVIAFNKRYVILHHLTMKTNKRDTGDASMLTYIVHGTEIDDTIADVILALESRGIDFLSKQKDILIGAIVKLSIVRLMKQSSKICIFLNHETLKDDLSQFEFDMLTCREANDIVIVTLIELSSADLNTLPHILKTMILNNEHLQLPSGVCSSSQADYSCFIHALVSKLHSDSHKFNTFY